MIKESEINPKGYDLTDEQAANLAILLERINKVRAAYGKPMSVSSGVRSMADHLRIYKEKGITDQSKIPMKSRHLLGAAVDIRDPDLKLAEWVKANEKVLEEAELWCESLDATKGWVHFQIFPPASGKRFFNP